MMNNKLLALDTSTAELTVALAVDGAVAAQRCSRAERNHSILLLPEIDTMLKEAGIAPSELDAVAVGTGPGSYTGVRIGVTVAKTFAWSLGIPVIGVSGLEALALGDRLRSEQTIAQGESGGPAWYVPLLDARRGQAFCAVYAADRDGMRAVAEDGIRVVADWLGALREEAESAADREGGTVRIVFGGETAGFRETLEAWRETLGGGKTAVEIVESGIRAADIAALALRRVERGQSDDMHGLVPNYTQLAEAEVKLLEKEKREGGPFGGIC